MSRPGLGAFGISLLLAAAAPARANVPAAYLPCEGLGDGDACQFSGLGDGACVLDTLCADHEVAGCPDCDKCLLCGDPCRGLNPGDACAPERRRRRHLQTPRGLHGRRAVLLRRVQPLSAPRERRLCIAPRRRGPLGAPRRRVPRGRRARRRPVLGVPARGRRKREGGVGGAAWAPRRIGPPTACGASWRSRWPPARGAAADAAPDARSTGSEAAVAAVEAAGVDVTLEVAPPVAGPVPGAAGRALVATATAATAVAAVEATGGDVTLEVAPPVAGASRPGSPVRTRRRMPGSPPASQSPRSKSQA